MSELTINPVEVARLKIEPGEILMVTVPGVITMETADRIKDVFQAAFKETGGNVPSVLVIDESTKVSVVRATDVEPLT